MNEIASSLPREVIEFVAECRKKNYTANAEPNYPTKGLNEFGFIFKNDGFVYLDVSTEQDGRFSGQEQVNINSVNGNLNGRRVYICQYTGAADPYAQEIGEEVVDQAQHGLVMNHPGLVRFGARQVLLETSVGGKRFLYQEHGSSYGEGLMVNQELLFEISGTKGNLRLAYAGSSQFTVFSSLGMH